MKSILFSGFFEQVFIVYVIKFHENHWTNKMKTSISRVSGFNVCLFSFPMVTFFLLLIHLILYDFLVVLTLRTRNPQIGVVLLKSEIACKFRIITQWAFVCLFLCSYEGVCVLYVCVCALSLAIYICRIYIRFAMFSRIKIKCNHTLV